MSTKKIPPFGNRLRSDIVLRKRNKKYSVWVVCGSKAWDKATNRVISHPYTLCLPPWLDPNEYRWPVKDCEIMLLDSGCSDEAYLDLIAHTLFSSGAKSITAINAMCETIFYRT